MENVAVNNNKSTVVVPPEFICPITMEIMIHPVMTRYGHCFDRSAIITWMCSSDGEQCECPLTRKPLRISDIINNHSLGQRIKTWCDENCYQFKQSETLSTGSDDSTCNDEDDFVMHFFVSADLNKVKERKNRKDRQHRNSLARSQSLRNPTSASSTTLQRPKRNLIRMAVSWTQRS
jgi:U-box domain